MNRAKMRAEDESHLRERIAKLEKKLGATEKYFDKYMAEKAMVRVKEIDLERTEAKLASAEKVVEAAGKYRRLKAEGNISEEAQRAISDADYALDDALTAYDKDKP